MAEKKYEERDQFPTLIDGGQVDEAIVNTPPTEKGVFNTGITSTQIEQVVDLPVPTTDDEGKVLKVDAEGKWELSTDAEGTVVVANPTLAGTEADLTGLQVGATKYKVPEGTEVVNLTTNTGTLSDSDFAKVIGDSCIIYFSGTYFSVPHAFYKSNQYTSSQYGTVYVYKLYGLPENLITNVSGERQLPKQQIYIYGNTKDYSYSQTYETITNQVYANLELEGGEPSLNSLIVGSTKYKVGGSEVLAYEGTYSFPADVAYTGWSLHRAIKDGNILWLVIAGQIVNDSGASQTVSLMSITLPSSLSSHIYREDGTTCDNAYSSSYTITKCAGVIKNTVSAIQIDSLSANTIEVGSATLNTGTTRIDLRIPIFLDIGTVAS